MLIFKRYYYIWTKNWVNDEHKNTYRSWMCVRYCTYCTTVFDACEVWRLFIAMNEWSCKLLIKSDAAHVITNFLQTTEKSESERISSTHFTSYRIITNLKIIWCISKLDFFHEFFFVLHHGKSFAKSIVQ